MYKLYGRAGSGSLAVQVALEELQLPYEPIWVGREPKDVEAFRAINPTGRVPALRLPDGKVMFESAAMLIHLASVCGQSAFAPRPGTSQHATFVQWMVFLSANVYESALRVFYSARYSADGEGDAAAIRSQGLQDYTASLEVIAKGLARMSWARTTLLRIPISTCWPPGIPKRNPSYTPAFPPCRRTPH